MGYKAVDRGSVYTREVVSSRRSSGCSAAHVGVDIVVCHRYSV